METKLISGGASLTWAVGMGKKERKERNGKGSRICGKAKQ